MKTETAYIIDMYSYGSYHEVINQSILMMVSNLYENVVYVAEKSSCENLKKLLEASDYDYSNVCFREKRVFRVKKTGHPTIDYFIHILIRSILNFYHYMKTSKGCDVFYNNNIYFAAFFISFFSFGKSNRIFDICHNEMEEIDEKHVSTNIGRFMHAYLHTFFCIMRIGRRFKFILLSERMAEYFKSFIPERNHHAIDWIDHSYIRAETENVKVDTSKLRQGLRIGIPGLISSSRGLGELQVVLARLNNPDVNIYSISVVNGSIISPRFVELNQTGKLLPAAEYASYASKMDALILLYKLGSYRLTASGAILEAIWNEKPVFAIENEYFKYLFDKFGALGKLFRSAEDLSDYLNTLDVASLKDYSGNLKKAKHALHPMQIKEQMLRVINSNN